jgi:ABC-type bacteriocin/lantibiotic exporter with double-glycine peptidase domain
VAQEDGMGCGLACIAMIAGTTYAVAKKIIHERRPRTSLVTSYVDLVWALERLGFACTATKRAFPGWGRLRGRAIVAINRAANGKKKDPTWHWVVFDEVEGQRYVFDPEVEAGGLRSDFSTMKGRGFIQVVNA